MSPGFHKPLQMLDGLSFFSHLKMSLNLFLLFNPGCSLVFTETSPSSIFTKLPNIDSGLAYVTVFTTFYCSTLLKKLFVWEFFVSLLTLHRSITSPAIIILVSRFEPPRIFELYHSMSVPFVTNDHSFWERIPIFSPVCSSLYDELWFLLVFSYKFR